jgi:hypothetical protein
LSFLPTALKNGYEQIRPQDKLCYVTWYIHVQLTPNFWALTTADIEVHYSATKTQSDNEQFLNETV